MAKHHLTMQIVGRISCKAFMQIRRKQASAMTQKLSAVNEALTNSIPQFKQPKETVKINPQHPLATRHFDYPKPNKSNETLQIK